MVQGCIVPRGGSRVCGFLKKAAKAAAPYGLLYAWRNRRELLLKLKDLFALPAAHQRLIPFEVRDNSVLLVEIFPFHGECLPGMAKYLLDLGFMVDVVYSSPAVRHLAHAHEDRNADTSLFCRFTHKNLRVFPASGITLKLLLKSPFVTKYRHIVINTYYASNPRFFDSVWLLKFQPLCVIHHGDDVPAVCGNYRAVAALVPMDVYGRNPLPRVNAHYFCAVSPHAKNNTTVFVSAGGAGGAGSRRVRNFDLLFRACDYLAEKHMGNYRVVLLGSGNPAIPAAYAGVITDLGLVSWETMYAEIEKADFILSLIDAASHRYTNAASGSFQLSLGFLKPLLLHRKFAPIAGFSGADALLYDRNLDLGAAMERAITMSAGDYAEMVTALQETERAISDESRANLAQLLASPPA